MAYSTSNPPALVTKRVGASGGIWVYKDGDSVATANGINYITNAAKLGMKAGDVVFHIDETNLTTTQMSVITGATTGTASGATCSAIEPVGETSIALSSAGTGTILAGDVITFGNGDETEYLVTTGDSDVSNGGTLVITPGLVVATAVGTPIKVKTTVLNLTEGAVSNKLISGSGATRTLTKAETGANVLFDRAAGIVFTLPTPVPGMRFKFIVTTLLTSNAYSVITGSASVFIIGSLHGIIEGAATDEAHVANGTTHVGVSMNATTTGGLVGGIFELEAISSTLWAIRGTNVCTATPATPFTT
jgi:hypothetical protein